MAFASSMYLLPQIPGPACLNPPNPLFKWAHQASVRTRAHGHRFAVLRPASDDALLILRSVLFRYVMQLGQTLTMCAAFTSSMYLLPQIPGPACLNPPNPLFKWALQASVRTGAHGHRFAVLRPASDDALVALRTVLLRYVVWPLP